MRRRGAATVGRGDRLAILALGLVLAACTPVATGTGASGGGGPTALTVFGAASLTGVLGRFATAYHAANPDITITVSTGSSAALATQIDQGAPADVFLSADTANAQRLVDDGNADGSLVAFAGNELALVVPPDNPARVTSPIDLARPGLRIVAAGDEVPVTTYATQLVANLAHQPGYPASFAAAYAANVVSREDDVKAVIAKVELGEGDAGIVYRTDAIAAGAEVAIVDLPPAANVRARYAGVVLAGSRDPAAARAFLAWVAGPDGQAILAAAGFVAAP